AWGNNAFPDAPLIGHILCRERLLREGDALLEKQREDPERYADVRLCPPDLTFDRGMAIDAGGFTVALHHLPGHTRDCIVAHVPEHDLLLAGDCAEEPIPLLYHGPLDRWIAALRSWDDPARVRTVIPSHGPVSGRDLLTRNADYLASLLAGRAGGWQPAPDTPAFYRDAHAHNLQRAATLLGTD
ncbi:MAG TPA: MBL fold metallo-hydrolase, partial [Chloroflexota bacterium]|nr:MBL fold metallo-hydrolase [Chloroflexota bacterium]